MNLIAPLRAALLRARIVVIEADIERLERRTPARIHLQRQRAQALRSALATERNADAVRGMVERNAKRHLLA